MSDPTPQNTGHSPPTQAVGGGTCCITCAYALAGLAPTGNCPECGTPIAKSLAPRYPDVVGTDRYCITCAYALVGLSSAGACPECGTSIALSLREPTLANAAPEYLRTLRAGLWLVLNGILLMIVGIIGVLILNASIGNTQTAGIISSSVMFAISAIIMLGYWKFSTPDPGQVALEATNSARIIIRTVVPIQAGLTALQVAMEFIPPSGTPGFGVVQIVGVLGTLAGLVLQAIQFFGVMRYTRWLATRVPDFFVVKRTKKYMWLLPLLYTVGAIAAFLGPLVALVMYWNLLDRMHKHVKSIIATGEPASLKKRLA